jgi:reticulon-4-interacting protein 1, mitochondrial
MTSSFDLICAQPGPNSELRLCASAIPKPKNNQVLIRVLAASVNPIDTKRAQGYGRRLLSIKGASGPKLVLGNDFAGEVVSAGATADFQPRIRVFGVLPTDKNGGTHRSFIVADASLVRPIPEGLKPRDVCPMPYAFCTLWKGFEGLDINPLTIRGKRVLIQGGAAAIGQLATQILTLWGAEVTVACSGQNAELCRSLGAKAVVDRRKQSVSVLDSTFHATLNFGSWDDEPALLSRLAPDAIGHASTVHPTLGEFDRSGWVKGAVNVVSRKLEMTALMRARAPRGKYCWVIFDISAGALDALTAFLMAGKLRLSVGLEVPFAQAAEAFEFVAAGNPTKALLVPES